MKKLSTCHTFLSFKFDLHRALGSKQAELRDAYGELSKMKENLEMLKNRIAEEQAHVEILKKQLGKGWLTWHNPLYDLVRDHVT